MFVIQLFLYFLFFLTVNSIEFEYFYNELQKRLFEDSSLFSSFKNSSTKYTLKRYEEFVHTYSEKLIVAGFRFEEHKIITDDGYILSIWRIPGPLGDYSKKSKKPIILQHGLLDDSYTFLALNINRSLPLILAREGYDIWLPNVRGNIFSLEHINRNEFDSNQFYSKYWNFSFHEMAVFDLPAYINYVKGITGFEKVIYIGHSQGTLIFYINFMLNSTYLTSNIEKFVGLGSVLRLDNIKSSVASFLEYTWFLDLLDKLKIYNVLNMGTEINRLFHLFCKNLISVCKSIINSIIGTKNTNMVNWNEMEGLFYYEPGGSSTKNMMHWIQNVRDKKLRYFNYGKEINIEIYGQPEPPDYNTTELRNFNFSSYIVAGDSDPFVQKSDFDLFLSMINLEGKTISYLENYNHLDYLWAEKARDDIYIPLIDFLK